jgi:hypothetical protein
MHSAIVVINMPEKHESEGHHPRWLTFLAGNGHWFDLSQAEKPNPEMALTDADDVAGHSRPKWSVHAMSGLPPLATALRTFLIGSFVPGAAIP